MEGKTLTATQRMERSREARNDRVQEVVLLLSWLTQLADVEAHLAHVDRPTLNSTMNYIVCLHHGSERLVWRISDFEVLEYFKHLKTRPCTRGMSRDDKMSYLAQHATEGLTSR